MRLEVVIVAYALASLVLAAPTPAFSHGSSPSMSSGDSPLPSWIGAKGFTRSGATGSALPLPRPHMEESTKASHLARPASVDQGRQSPSAQELPLPPNESTFRPSRGVHHRSHVASSAQALPRPPSDGRRASGSAAHTQELPLPSGEGGRSQVRQSRISGHRASPRASPASPGLLAQELPLPPDGSRTARTRGRARLPAHSLAQELPLPAGGTRLAHTLGRTHVHGQASRTSQAQELPLPPDGSRPARDLGRGRLSGEASPASLAQELPRPQAGSRPRRAPTSHPIPLPSEIE